MSATALERYLEVAEVSKIYRNGTADAVEAVSSVSFSQCRVASLSRSWGPPAAARAPS